jgi:hypothetical protein
MAWGVCIVKGCQKRKPIQPFFTNTVHKWLCPKHRAEAQEKHIDSLARAANAKRSLARIMNSRQ